MLNFNKEEIKKQINIEDLFEIVEEFNGEPQYTNFGFISATICHNPAGEGSHKLYYYENSGLFYCYSGCEQPSFDIFELVQKVARTQWKQDYDLNDAVRWVAYHLGITGNYIEEDKEKLEDWDILNNYEKIKTNFQAVPRILEEYDDNILSHINYNIKLTPWLNEGITQEMLDLAEIGFYPPTDQITIPHFDQNNRFIGLRGRTLCTEEAELYGKYRPMRINRILYNHPLGFNLYGLNWNKEAIQSMKTAVVVESEKSVLKYGSYFGKDNNICVACCGSSLSTTQVLLLLNLGVTEIVLAFDKQFKEVGDNDEAKQWEKKLRKIHDKYQNEILISIIWDKYNLLNYKDSPLDINKDIYLELYKKRIIL